MIIPKNRQETMLLSQQNIGEAENVLVTGGGGFLGYAIVERLVQRGRRVRTFGRSLHPALETLGVEQIQGDLRDPWAVDRACREMNVVFHTAAKTGVWGSYREYHLVNTIGTQNVTNACRQYGVERLVYTSSPSVVFDGKDMRGADESAPYPPRYHAPYPKTKAMAEKAVIQAAAEGLKTIVLRPHLIWGPGDNHLVPRILARAEQLRRVGSGTNQVDTTYIDNAAEAHLLADAALAADPGLSGRCYFISQGEPIRLWEMVDAILKAGGKPPVEKSIPTPLAWVAGVLLEGVHTLFRIETEPRMTRFVAGELSTDHWFDISAAQRDLGYAPQVSTAEGLRRLEAWLQSTNAQ